MPMHTHFLLDAIFIASKIAGLLAAGGDRFSAILFDKGSKISELFG